MKDILTGGNNEEQAKSLPTEYEVEKLRLSLTFLLFFSFLFSFLYCVFILCNKLRRILAITSYWRG